MYFTTDRVMNGARRKAKRERTVLVRVFDESGKF